MEINTTVLGNKEKFNDTRIQCPVCGTFSTFHEIERTNDYILLRCAFCDLEFAESMHYDFEYYKNLHYAAAENLNEVLILFRDEFI